MRLRAPIAPWKSSPLTCRPRPRARRRLPGREVASSAQLLPMPPVTPSSQSAASRLATPSPLPPPTALAIPPSSRQTSPLAAVLQLRLRHLLRYRPVLRPLRSIPLLDRSQTAGEQPILAARGQQKPHPTGP